MEESVANMIVVGRSHRVRRAYALDTVVGNDAKLKIAQLLPEAPRGFAQNMLDMGYK